jgi:MYXO-CTERM domain-containing protein
VRPSLVLLTGLAIGCQAPIPESSTAQEVVTLSPTSHDFGAVQIGASSAVFTVSVDPARNTSDDVTAVTASCADFAITALGLPSTVSSTCTSCVAGAPGTPDEGAIICAQQVICSGGYDVVNYTFDTQFTPTVAGTVSCVVTVQLNGGTSTKTLTLTGTGSAPPIHVAAQPASVGFGDVRRNTDGAATITVTNSGGAQATVSSVAVTGAGFAVTGPAAYPLGAGASMIHTVTCHPTAVGPTTGNLAISSDDPGTPVINVPLACNGIDSTLDVTPSPAALATTRVGEPIDATIMLANSGTASMTLENVSLTAAGITMTAAPGPGTVLSGSGGNAPVMVHFAAATAGTVTGTLVTTYDGGQTRSTQISARALGTSMALTPDGDVDFGPVCGGQSKAVDFTLIANDQGAFSVRTISTPAAPFALAAPALPASVAGAGASQTRFKVTAAPTGAGVATSTMVVHTDIPGATDRTVNLSVQGLAAGVTATPDVLDLGFKHINTTTIGQEVHLSNCAVGPLAFSNARIEGPNADDFAIVAQPMSPTIPPAGAATWLVVLQAHAVGSKAATFAVDYAGGTAMVPLMGEGVGDPVAATPGRGSYYACSAGQPSSLWPLAIALGLVLRRRRR